MRVDDMAREAKRTLTSTGTSSTSCTIAARAARRWATVSGSSSSWFAAAHEHRHGQRHGGREPARRSCRRSRS